MSNESNGDRKECETISEEETIRRNISIIKRAADDGDGFACFSLSEIYLMDDCPDRDPAKAMYYLEKALKCRYGPAYENMGIRLILGDGIEKDVKLGLEVLRRGTSLGDAGCFNTLGDIYCYGDIVPNDINRAMEYYRSANSLSHPESFKAMGLIYDKG